MDEPASPGRPPQVGTDSESENRRRLVLEALAAHETRLTQYAARLTGDVHAARDVVQHVFLKLCDDPPTGRNGQLVGWLYAVCHNRAMDFRRRAGRTVSLESAAAESLGRDEADPAGRAEALDAVELLRGVIDALPDAQRLVVNLWSAGFSYREISETLGKTESYVRVASHRAWQTIRRHPAVQRLVRQNA